jgi:hypothetical protein
MVPIIIIKVKVIVRVELVGLIARIIGTTIQKSLGNPNISPTV